MKSFFLLLLAVFTLAGAHAQQQEADTLVSESFGQCRHTVYVTHNKKDPHYRHALSFETDISLPAQRKRSIIPSRWVRLNLYKGAYYLYAASDRGNDYRLLIREPVLLQFMMEPVIDTIRHITATGYGYRIEIAAGSRETPFPQPQFTAIEIHLLDKAKGTAIFIYRYSDGSSEMELMVEAAKATGYPVIINDCPCSKTYEFSFDTPDFNSLLNESMH